VDLKQYIGEAISFIIGGGLFSAANEYYKTKNQNRVTDFDQLAAKFKDLYEENKILLVEHKNMYDKLEVKFNELEKQAEECEMDRKQLRNKIYNIEQKLKT
jgi:regulator of replication initiation timing